MRRKTRNSSSLVRICLAMVVCDDSKVIARCLNSVLPFIDHYQIIDTGSIDDTVDIIQGTLCDVQGEINSRTFIPFNEARLQIFREASACADFVLFINADETLQSIGDELAPTDGFDVGRIETGPGPFSFVLPRLIRTNTSFSPQGSYAESVEFPEHVKQSFLSHVRICQHMDGDRNRNRVQILREKECLTKELRQGFDPVTGLELARISLRMNEPLQAKEILSKKINLKSSGQSTWHAFYLMGLISEKTEPGSTESQEYFQRAFEIAPDRLEPLYRLIKIRQTEGDFTTALSLCDIAQDIQIPVHFDYFERPIYEFEILSSRKTILKKLKILKSKQMPALDKKNTSSTTNTAQPDIDPPGHELHSSLSSNLAKPSDLTDENKPSLTIGMATFDDYDGVYFSVMAILLYHPEVLSKIEIIIIDNNPEGQCNHSLKMLCNSVAIARYIPVGDIRGTAVRNNIFAYARGEAVLCVDSHVFVFPGAINQLIAYFTQNSECNDLLQGPLMSDDMQNVTFCMHEGWRDGMFGTWKSSPKPLESESAPFEIELQGLGLFACRLSSWPGLNPRLTGFGGEEGYLHEKFRRNGGKTICLPFLRWIHRFERPMGNKYPNIWGERIRNYLIAYDELGQDTRELQDHFSKFLGFVTMAKARHMFEIERAHSFYAFDAIYCIKQSDDSDRLRNLQRQFERLGIAHRIRWFKIAVTTDGASDRIRTHDNIVKIAQRSKYKNILIFEDDVLFRRDAGQILNTALHELQKQPWDICYFGIEASAHSSIEKVSGFDYLAHFQCIDSPPNVYNGLHAYALHSIAYKKYLQASSSNSMNSFITIPKITTQIHRLNQEQEPIRYVDLNEH